MSIRKTNESGFGLVEIIFIFLSIAVIGMVTWFVYNHYTSSRNNSGTTLTITRSNPLNQSGVSNFTKDVSSSVAIIVLRDIDSLKPVPGGPNTPYSCPLDDGVNYIFIFNHPSLRASATATGCQWVTINSKSYLSTDKFWTDVSSATGQPKDPDTSFP